jgi:hypothetical protein
MLDRAGQATSRSRSGFHLGRRLNTGNEREEKGA